MDGLRSDTSPVDARPPSQRLADLDSDFDRLMAVHDGAPGAEAPPDLFEQATDPPAGGGGGGGISSGGVRFESDDQARARGSAARHDALSATVAGCPASAKVLAMLQQAVAHELVVSFGEPTVSLAKRHLKLGLKYLEMGWPAAALAQAEKAREVNKQLLAAEDLEDDKVSETEALHPKLLLLNAKANLCLGQIKRARSSHKRARDMADILYGQAVNNEVWCELGVVEAYALAAEGDVDAGFDAVFQALETAETLHALQQDERLCKVGEMFTHASRLCLLENDEEEALEYAIKAHKILKENASPRGRLCADAALRAATIAALVGKHDEAKPLFAEFFDCPWYAPDSLATVAASRWHGGRDKDGLTVLARLVLGRRVGDRAAAGGESLATFFAAIDAPGLTRAWGKTAVLTALRVRAAEGMKQNIGTAADEPASASGSRTKPDQWAYDRLTDASEAARPKQQDKESSSGSSARPAWGGSGVGSAVTATRKTPRKSAKPAKRPGSSGGSRRKRRGSSSSARSGSGSGTEGEESESLPASAPDTPPPTPTPASTTPPPQPSSKVEKRKRSSLPQLEMPGRSERDELFRRMDYNGNNTLSLAEIDKAVIEIWPQFNHKPALMRAYKAADVSKDGWVGRKEFRLLLEYLVYFNNLWDKFDEIDSSGDRRLSVDEFIAGCGVVGERLSGSEAEAEFALIDSNHGGYVLFDEFCTWCASRQVLEDDDDDDATADAAQAAAPAPEPEPEPEPVRPVSPKSKRHIARLEMPGRSERDELFRRMDYNGNNTLSLAEIDKAVIEIWPQFNHKPALMRAYKAADVSKDGWVGRKEFRLLLEYLVYFNNLWDKFDEIDSSGDRRLSVDEFIAGCGVVGERLSGSEAEAEFALIDSNHGGYVLFDEFCTWCASRQVLEDEDDDDAADAAQAAAPAPEPEPEPAWQAEPEPEPEPEPEHQTWLDSDSGSGSGPAFDSGSLDGEADSKKDREAKARRKRYQAEEDGAATPAAAVERDAASRRSLPQGKPTHWRRAATAGQRSPGVERRSGSGKAGAGSRQRPQTAAAMRRSEPMPHTRSKSVQRAGSAGRQRVKVAQPGTGKKLGADLEAQNLEVLDQASFAQHASGVAKDRESKKEDSKKARLARLDRMQRPGTAPANRDRNRQSAQRKSGKGAPSMMGPKKKRDFGAGTKELDAKLRASKLKNLLRRIAEEAAGGPNYHGTTKINPLDFYEFGEEIGKGAFGKVRVATHLLTGAQVAVKTYEKHIIRKFESRRADVGETVANTPDIPGDGSAGSGKKRTGNLNDRKPFCVEAEILVRLNHTNCVELYQTIDSAQRIHVIIEFVDGGTLDQYCKQFTDRKLEEVEAARVFAPIASALEYVHSRSICHRDVKLDNVLLYKHTQAVRLADYGLGEFVQKGKKLKLLCGTPAYVAPEIVENKQYSGTAVDVWSLGTYDTIQYNTI